MANSWDAPVVGRLKERRRGMFHHCKHHHSTVAIDDSLQVGRGRDSQLPKFTFTPLSKQQQQ